MTFFTRRKALFALASVPVLSIVPSSSAPVQTYSDPDDDIQLPDELNTAADFAAWNLGVNVSNHRRHGEPWPAPVESIDWEDKFIIIMQHPDPESLDPIAEQVLAEVDMSGLPIVGAARTPCGRVACLMLLGSRKLFAQRMRLVERGMIGGDA